jgi:hypothetical protein
MLSGYVRDDPEAVGAVLMREWQEADAKDRKWLAQSLGRLRVRAAVPLLAAELDRMQGDELTMVANALLDVDETDARAKAVLTRMLEGTDAEVRRRAWRLISQSPGASACFLERAVSILTEGQSQDVHRELRIIESAMARRRDDALRQLAGLQRLRDRSVADQVRQTYERLSKGEPR